MNLYNELQNLRAELINDINMKFDFILKQIDSESSSNSVSYNNEQKEYEIIMPLCMHSSAFKGQKPVAVIFKDGSRINIRSWKNVVSAILSDCIKDKNMKQQLYKLTGRISGRNRVLLSSSQNNMRSPLKIDENLFMESHYDTETLIRILTTRILEPVGYDYSQINIAIRAD